MNTFWDLVLQCKQLVLTNIYIFKFQLSKTKVMWSERMIILVLDASIIRYLSFYVFLPLSVFTEMFLIWKQFVITPFDTFSDFQ